MNKKYHIDYSITQGFAALPEDHIYMVAEAGNNHKGELDLAYRLIDLAIDAGCDAVKFQKRDISSMLTAEFLDEPFNKFVEWTEVKTYRDVRNKIELNEEEFVKLKEYCKGKIDFIVTPFDLKSVELMQRVGVDAYKIAGFSLTDVPVLEAVAATGKPVFVSVGACTKEDLERALNILKKSDILLFHCISCYPMQPEDANLNLIDWLKTYGKPVGYSDHEDGITVTPVAVGKGARALEKHYTLDRNMTGFDHAMSLSPQMLRDWVKSARESSLMLGTLKERKTHLPAEQMIVNKKIRTIVATKDLEEGHIITRDDLTTKGPNLGLHTKHIKDIIGKKMKKTIKADTHITKEDVEWK